MAFQADHLAPAAPHPPRWPPALEGHCFTHCTCYQTNPKLPPRLPPDQYSKLLDFPPEILTHIALYLPYPSDAVALSQTHPVFRNLFSEHNQLFWYKISQSHIHYHPSYKYDDRENYYKKIMDAFSSKDARCQICCVKRAYKFWPDFKRRICPECFEDMTIDQVKIRFLGIPEMSYRLQKRYRGQSVHWACWKPDVERAVEKKYPGRNLVDLLKVHVEQQEQKRLANHDYRTKTRQAIEARAIEVYKREFQYLHPLVPVEKFESYVKIVYLPEVERLTALVRPKKPVWVDAFARNNVLPVWKDVLTHPSGVPLPPKHQIKRRIPYDIKSPVVAYHQERFRARGAGLSWSSKSDPRTTLLIGTCAICATTDLNEYVRRERQKLFPPRAAEEPDKTLIKEREWMTPQALMDHYELHHTMEFFSTKENVSYNACEAGKGGFWFWDGIPTGVEGLEQFLHLEKYSGEHQTVAHQKSREGFPPEISSTRPVAIDAFTNPIGRAVLDGNASSGSSASAANTPPNEDFQNRIENPSPECANPSSTSHFACSLGASHPAMPTQSTNPCPYNSSPFASSASSARPKEPTSFFRTLIVCSERAFNGYIKIKAREWYRYLYEMETLPDRDSIFWTSNPSNQTPLNFPPVSGGSESERMHTKKSLLGDGAGDDGDSSGDSGNDDDDDDDDDDDRHSRFRARVRRISEATQGLSMNGNLVLRRLYLMMMTRALGNLVDRASQPGGSNDCSAS